MKILLSPLVALLMAMTAMTVSRQADAAELIMFEQAGCVWCARFNAEVAPGYAKSSEGRLAPLRRVDINAPIPDDLKDVKIEKFTPTFVLFDQGAEIGRIRGYPGDQFFWFLVDELIAKLPGQSDKTSDDKAAVPESGATL